MSKKIVIFGDSYTIDSTYPNSYINLLRKNGYEVETLGEAGASNWNIAFSIINYQKYFDIIVVFWTIPYRVYHPKYCLTSNTIKNSIPINKDEKDAFIAAESFYNNLFFQDKEDFSFSCLLLWFDEYFKKTYFDKKIINGWAFSKADSKNTMYTDTITNPTFHYRFSIGVEIRPSLSYLTFLNNADAINDISLINHLDKLGHDIIYRSLIYSIDNYKNNFVLDFRKI